MKTTLLKALILVFLVGCNSAGAGTSGSSTQQSSNEKDSQFTKNRAPQSEADRVKDSLIVPAIDALSYQLEKAGYDAYVLNKLNSFLKETSITEFLKNNPTLKEIEKIIESGKKQTDQSIKQERQKQAGVSQAQEVFETF